MKGFAGRIAVHITVFCLIIGGWELAVRVLGIPAIIVPTPSAVALALWDGLMTGEFLIHVLVTLWEILAGFVLGAVCGLALGFAVALSPSIERVFYPYIVAFQTVPKVAIAPIIVIWFGYGLTSKVIITATIAFFPLLANTITGLHATPRDEIDMLRAYTASRWQIFYMARLRQALPYIFVGLDIAVVLAVIGAIVGEFVGAKAGLGFIILQKNFNFDMAGTFAILVILAAIGTGLHALVAYAHRKVVFWVERSADPIVGA